MNSKIISIDLFKQADTWNPEFFFKKENKLKSSKYYKSIKLHEFLEERKEFLIPSNFKNQKFNYIGLENITRNTRDLAIFEPKLGNKIKSRCKIFRRGDLLYGRLRPTLNKGLLIDEQLEEGICSTEIFVLKVKKEYENIILSEYIIEILISSIILEQVEFITTGASLPRVQIKDFLNLEIPIPKVKTQYEIIQKAIEYRKLANEYLYFSNQINKSLSIELIESIKNNTVLDIQINKNLENQKYYNPLPKGDFNVNSRKKA